MQMLKFTDFFQTRTGGKLAVFGVGDFKIPTNEHLELFDKINTTSNELNTDYRIFDIAEDYMVKHYRKLFPRHARSFRSGIGTEQEVVLEKATEYFESGYGDIMVYVEESRKNDILDLLHEHNGLTDRHGYFNFHNISVMGFQPVADDTLYKSVEDNNVDEFMTKMPVDSDYVHEMYNSIRTNMGLEEVEDFRRKVKFEPISEEREAYKRGDLFNVGEEVQIATTEEVVTITRLATNYVIVEHADGRSTRKWVTDLTNIKED